MYSLSSRLFDLALEVLTFHQVGDVVLIVALLGLLQVLVALGELAERGQRVRAELVKDAGNELSQLLILTVAVDGEGVVGDSGVDLRGGKVDDITIRLEHVDLLDSLDGLGTQLLQGCLELLVIGAGPSGSTLDLASGGALSTNSGARAELLEALLDVRHNGLCSGGIGGCGGSVRKLVQRFWLAITATKARARSRIKF
jgi:hypothetical protein